MREMFDRAFPRMSLGYIGREESASPATGSHSRHEREQRQIVEAAFTSGANVITDGAPAAPQVASGGVKVRIKK